MKIEYVYTADDPVVSVVIPSVPANDHSKTTTCLTDQALDQEYELLVVNDDQIDRSTARNRGIERASAEIVALTDDDCEPPADWLSSIVRAFTETDDLVCLEGPITGGSTYTGTRHYVGCNLAVQRDAALSVGGFDSRYAGWREDTEFGWRMERQTEGTCAYSPAMRMCHPTVPRSPLDRRRERLLKAEYPKRYDRIIDANPARRLYRWARAVGLTRRINGFRNRLRRHRRIE